ncbi:alpha/beta hydrolase [Spirosoma telluris]|uniref:alpha/beta hydrolase n=1 Tax=Spirosoma telluris TaxID=2183553 RepID=UPI002FC3DF91
MKTLSLLCLLIFSPLLLLAQVTESYPVHPDAQPQEGVPKGEVLKFTFDTSKIFPGTWREYWVYVPAQYQPSQPACVYINQDGVQWQAPAVFDNLIHKKEMPVTIGVFVMHGRVKAANPNEALDRFNRSFEYDGLGDKYARFLLEELLPDVETRKTSDGRAIRLSKNGNDRAIGGSSSGPFVRSRLPGNVPMPLVGYSAQLVRMLVYVGPTRSIHWSVRLNLNHFAFFYRTVPTTSTYTPVTGGWPIKPWNEP